jgi:hypothetical protein
MAAWTGSQTILFWEYHSFNDASEEIYGIKHMEVLELGPMKEVMI